jgi:DNA-binding MarR family transcriptional regulator
MNAKSSGKDAEPSDGELTHEDYEVLASFRQALRRIGSLSEQAARQRGLTPQQHQALLALKGAEGRQPLSIGGLAAALGIRPHSGVELVDRLVQLGLVERQTDQQDHRRVRVLLTERAQAELQALAAVHQRELREIRPALQGLLARFEHDEQRESNPDTQAQGVEVH